MPSITVKRGIQFRPELYNQAEHSQWFDAVGDGATTKLVKDGPSLKAAMKELQAQATAANTIDDVVKGDATLATGDSFDFSKGSNLAKALGLADTVRSNYTSAYSTDYGKAAKVKPEASLVIDGITLQAKAPPVDHRRH